MIRSMGPDMIMVVDTDREIAMCNDAVESVFGYTAKEVQGWRTDRLYFDRRVTGERHEIFNHIKQVGFHTGFAKGRRKDGRIIPLEIITGELPHGPGAVVLVRDITERKRAEDQLIKAKEEAEAAHKELAELEQIRVGLTHMIVHDLKSPLTAMSGYLELLTRCARPRLDEKENGFLDEAYRLTRRLSEMITSLLDLRRLESKELPLNPLRCDLKVLVGEAMRLIGPEAQIKNIDVDLPREPQEAYCDREIVRRVLVNLLSNAIKFTPSRGRIRISLAGENGHSRVAVRDSGPGIPSEYHEKIFERFAQIEVREFSTGLGLTFCKLAVEAHGGRIGVTSRENEGSTFWFELPAAPPGAEADRRVERTQRP